MSNDWRDKENYCKDCDISIYGNNPFKCDLSIENNGKYVRSGKCFCKIKDGKMAESYSWEERGGKK